jgi:hypothetical protein
MTMRILRIILSSTVLLLLILSAFVAIPSSVSAREFSGTFPSIAAGTSCWLNVGYCAVGDIIWWIWTSSESLGFELQNTRNWTPISGFSNDDGYVVQTAGWFALSWSNGYNNKSFFDASVSYWVEIFTPTTAISAPSDCYAYLSSHTIDVQGTTDGHAAGILVGPDALHLRTATTAGMNWRVDDLVLNEGRNTILVRSCYWLDSYGYNNYTIDKTIYAFVDSISPDLAIISPITTSSSGTYLKGIVNISWQCSDDNGIFNREVKVDGLDWEHVATDSFTTQIADGQHVIQVRVTDLVGNEATGEITFVSDTVAPQVTIVGPEENARITKDHAVVSWSGSDNLSGLDHYEVQIIDGDWVDVGNATSYELTNLDNHWYSVCVKAVDRSGNNATSTACFGIYPGMWSTNSPDLWIPWFALTATVILAAILSVLVYWRKRGAGAKPPPQEPPQEMQ